MILRKRSMILSTILALACGASVSAQTIIGKSAEEQEARLARRAEAQRLVSRVLAEKSVRPVESKVIEADAQRLVAGLSEKQIAALLEGEDLSRVQARQGAPERMAAGATENAVANDVRLATAAALGDADTDLLFVPVTPCRIIDTRLGSGVLPAGQITPFDVVGNASLASQGGSASGCGIPEGASTPIARSIVVNFVAVGPGGPGHLEAWEYGQPVPTASVINYANVPGLNIANGVVVPITGVSTAAHDLNIRANVSGTYVVADVTGYFTRFPTEQFQGNLKSTVAQNDVTQSPISLGDGACHELNTCTVTAGANGTVIVEAWGQAVVDHTSGTQDSMELSVESAAAVACDQTGSNLAIYDVSSALGSNPDVDFVITLGRAYSQTSGSTKTYRLSGQMASGASANDKIENTRLICTFIPD